MQIIVSFWTLRGKGALVEETALILETAEMMTIVAVVKVLMKEQDQALPRSSGCVQCSPDAAPGTSGDMIWMI